MAGDFYTYFPEIPFEKDSSRQKEISSFLIDQCGHFVRAHEFLGVGIIMRAHGLSSADEINKELTRLYDKEAWKLVESPAPPPEIVDILQRLYNPSTETRAIALPPASEPASYKVEKDPLEKLVGVDSILQQFRDVSETITTNRFSNEHLGTAIPDGFMNVLIVGATGVGATTIAKGFADSLMYRKIVVSDDAPVFIKAISLAGKSSGHSENNLLEKMQEARKGILIIDDIDNLLDVHSYGESTLNALNAEMGNSRNHPVVIATCREARYAELMNANDGLAGRFAHTFHIYAVENKTLLGMFKNKVDEATLICDDNAVFKGLDALLDTARKAKRGAFANGHEIEAIFGAVMTQKLVRQRGDIEAFKNILARGKKIPEDRLRDYRTVRLEDVPVFDRALRRYVAKVPALPAPERKTVIALRPAVRSNVLPFRPKPQD